MKHIVLLGDSIFDNKRYVNKGRDVITHVRDQIPDTWKATLRAVDGSVASTVSKQLAKVPNSATHLFLSVGGNDALAEADILQMKVSTSTEVFIELADAATAFETRYKKMLKAVLKLKKPTAVCSIYYPRFDDELTQRLSCVALATFNDVIIRLAYLSGLPLIDLRYVCDADTDYANAIEPSEAGGLKIASTILEVAQEHDFKTKKTSVYF